MNHDTLNLANKLDSQSKETARISERLENFNLKYITFENNRGETTQMSALLKSDITHDLFTRIKEDLIAMKSVYDHKLKQL